MIMTPEQLEEIKKALEEATPGPWKWQITMPANDEDGVNVGDLDYWDPENPSRGTSVLTTMPNKYGFGVISAYGIPEATIIANAPEWLRLLVETVESQKAMIKGIMGEECKWCNGMGVIRDHPSDTGYGCPDCRGEGVIR